MSIGSAPHVKRVMVGTDRSETADRAVRWAANLARAYDAELLLLQVLIAPREAEPGEMDEKQRVASESLQIFANEIAGANGRGLVRVHFDPADAVIEAVHEQHVDVVVVGNVGMAGRKEFLLGNIPNRISHKARCTIVIVNTAQLDGYGSAQASTRDSDEHDDDDEGSLIGRAWRIGRVMTRAGLRDVLTRGALAGEEAQREAAQRLRNALDELGPTFAKLGQILSTRPDLLPKVFIDELASLQDRVTPLTEAEVVAAMEHELAVPWEDVFASIDPRPMAAGTIAQVHRATLETGERVVVKVQRPTAEQDILKDLALLEMFAQKAARRPAFRRVFDIPAIVEHLASSLRRELDFREEADNIKRMQEVLESFTRLDVPGVYTEYSTARLLVMQEIQGVPVREAPAGPERDEAARQLLEAYYHQVLTEGFFHADPHPGNMMWWDEKIYFLDMGMVGRIDARMREMVLLLLLAFSQKDASFLAEIVLMLSTSDAASAVTDLAAFKADLESVIARYRDLSLREIQLGPMLQEVATISIRHNIRMPASFTLMGKAFAQMQLVAAELNPNLDPFSVAESYILRNTVRQLASNLNPQKIFYESQKAYARLNRMLEAVEGAVGARPGGHLQVDFRGTEHLEDTISRASRQLSLSLGLGGTLAITALTASSQRMPKWVPALAGTLSSVLAAGMLRSGRRK